MIDEREIDTFYTTMGDKGILVSYKKGDTFINHHMEAKKRSVADVSGAGDTVISVASLLTLSGVPKMETAVVANIAGGLVCEKVGVVPVNKEELIEEISNITL